MTSVSGYRMKSGKRVRGYTRSGGSLGFLRHSRSKGLTPKQIAHHRATITHGRRMGNLIYYADAEYKSSSPLRIRAAKRGLNRNIRMDLMPRGHYYKHR